MYMFNDMNIKWYDTVENCIKVLIKTIKNRSTLNPLINPIKPRNTMKNDSTNYVLYS